VSDVWSSMEYYKYRACTIPFHFPSDIRLTYRINRINTQAAGGYQQGYADEDHAMFSPH